MNYLFFAMKTPKYFYSSTIFGCLSNVSHSAENRLETNSFTSNRVIILLLYCPPVSLSIFIQNNSFLRFSLYYYSGNVDTEKQSETLLIIDTRDTKKTSRNCYVNLDDDEDEDEDDELGGRQVDYLEVVLGTK